jgi:hypothetical protein
VVVAAPSLDSKNRRFINSQKPTFLLSLPVDVEAVQMGREEHPTAGTVACRMKVGYVRGSRQKIHDHLPVAHRSQGTRNQSI